MQNNKSKQKQAEKETPTNWQRIEMVIQQSKMTANAFARHIGLPRGENLYQIKKGNNGISLDVATRICQHYPEIDKLWLLTGDGQMLRDDAPAGPWANIGTPNFVDPNMKGVFCSTGNEYPEIVRFVRHTDNIEIIHPAMPPREVMARYGFPLVSKEQAQAVRNIRTTNSDKLRTYRLYGDGVRRAGVLSEKWRYLISEPYMTSEKCCEILKKRPFRKFNAQTQSLGMVGTMADESKLRQTMYVRRGGCNVFSDNPRKVHSAPLSIWTAADCRDYIHRFDIPYCPIYDIPGITRTGCVFCGFGAHLGGGGGRFHILYTLHPKLYQMAMNYTNNGYTLRYALRRMGVQLPDEHPELF